VGIVSRILHSLDAAEEQALVFAYMSAQADEAVLTPALAGRSGSGKRCTSWPLVVRRAHASRFHHCCQSRDVNILQNRLPYGIMNEFFKEHGQLPGCPSMWITRQARALALGRLHYRGPARGKKTEPAQESGGRGAAIQNAAVA
jgi:hypothetical protein